jgi:DNA-binding MarR family transcriptional regulator
MAANLPDPGATISVDAEPSEGTSGRDDAPPPAGARDADASNTSKASEPSNAEAADPRLVRAVRTFACVSRVMEQIGRIEGVSMPQYRLLLFLRHGPRRAGELAAKVAVKRPTLTAIVDGLVRENRLRRVADEHDGRGVRIELTEEGHVALRKIEAELSELIEQLCLLGDRETLLDSLDDLSAIVDSEFDRHAKNAGIDPTKTKPKTQPKNAPAH